MVSFKKVGVLVSTAALTVGLLAPVASASTLGNERTETLPIQVAQTNTKVTKNDLIKRFRELFPKEFTNLTNKDFYMGTGYSQPNEPTVRYELIFSKEVNNQSIHGQLTFVGETLELEHFHFQPKYSKDALFPAKYSKDEAQKIADKFMKKLNKGENYELVPNEYNYYSTILTQPVQYSFSYVKKNAGIPILDQAVGITVLGDGTVTSYYKMQQGSNNYTYDDPSKSQTESAISKIFKESLNAELAYRIDTDYKTMDHSVNLIYQPNSDITLGVHALTGKWLTADGLSSTIAKQTITPIVKEALPAKQPNLTVEQAQAMAEKLLAIDKKGVTLKIESIEETTSETGKQVYTIHYQYEYKNGSTGTTLTIDKATGEIINYHDIKNSIDGIEDGDDSTPELTQQQLIDKAVAYVKEWVPSYAHQYALPTTEAAKESYNNSYYFTFPRIVNGLVVIGDQIQINIDAKTGDLLFLYVNSYDDIEWPDTTDIIAQKDATELFKKELKLNLQYENHPKVENEKHYSLVYQPMFKDSLFTVIDAKTGQWLDPNGKVQSDKPTIKHPTAAEELNYLVQTGILEVDEKFNPDASVTKEDAIKVLMNAFAYMDYYPRRDDDELIDPPFKDITQDHTLYPFVTQAIKMGTLEKSNGNFNATASLTNEEFAKWLIGTLKLSKAAQFSDIYTLNFKDAAKVKKENRGYVALAYAMGLLEAKDKQFNPTSKVTYAQLAQVTIRLAHKMYEYEIINY